VRLKKSAAAVSLACAVIGAAWRMQHGRLTAS
jgi:hypothetical protein